MLQLAIACLVIALIAFVLGFGGIAGSFVGVAKILFVVFLILAEEAGLAFFEYADNFKVVTTHAHLRAGDLRITREECVCCIHAKHHHVRTL